VAADGVIGIDPLAVREDVADFLRRLDDELGGQCDVALGLGTVR
jgi:hypothetical protein